MDALKSLGVANEESKRDKLRADAAWRKRIGEGVRQARAAKDKTLQQLSNEAGVDWTTIGRIERGERIPDLATVELLADSLEIAIDALVGRQAAISSEDAEMAQLSSRLQKLEGQHEGLRASLATLAARRQALLRERKETPTTQQSPRRKRPRKPPKKTG